jgi:hypothetical protein
VIVETVDAMLGKVTAPAIVRYWDNGHYEVNMLATMGEQCADDRNVHWWPLSEDEIKCKVGEVSIEKFKKNPSGHRVKESYTFNG